MKNEVVKKSVFAIPCSSLAGMLSISPRTAWRLLSAGKLPKPVALGGSKRFLMSDVELFLRCNCDMQRFNAEKGDVK